MSHHFLAGHADGRACKSEVDSSHIDDIFQYILSQQELTTADLNDQTIQECHKVIEHIVNLLKNR